MADTMIVFDRALVSRRRDRAAARLHDAFGAEVDIEACRRHAHEQFRVLDDHLALNDAGIPTIDIIDFAYPTVGNAYWHTSNDLPENCSGASLEQVGRVVTSWLTLPKRTRR